MRFVGYGIIVSFLVCVFISCANKEKRVEQGFVINEERTLFNMDMCGRPRGGSLYVPSSYTETRGYSLLIALHGAGATGRSLESLGFNQAADELDFIVAYPDGVGFRWDAPDDTPFVMALILELSARFSIDPRRVYLTGHSAGAIQAYELAVALPGQFAAVAPVAGLMATGNAPDGHPPLSILHIHATDDAEVPFDGSQEWGLCSTGDSLAYWRAVNERDAKEPATAESSDLGDGIVRTVWRGPQAETALIRLESGGHAWPSLATEHIVDFFYNHPARESKLSVTCGTGDLVTGNVNSLTLRARLASTQKASLVEYFANGNKVAESSRSPFSAVWARPERGAYRLTARVTHANGQTTKSTLNPTVIIAPKEISSTTFKATSSSVETDELRADFAIDGNMRTRWSSAWTDAESLTIDLGAARMVSGVTLAWEMAFGEAYALELSPDGVSWNRAFETRSGDGGYDHIPFPAQETRAIRIIGSKRKTEWGYSLWELLVHGE